MKKFAISLIVLFLLIFPSNVDAKLCDSTEYNKLKQQMYNVKISTEFVTDVGGNKYFELTFTNLTKEIKIVNGATSYVYNEANAIPSSAKVIGSFDDGQTYKFDVYGTFNSGCIDEFVGEKTITLPKYNLYSEYEQCVGYEDFPFCQKWYTGTIKDEKDFLDKLELYKKSLEAKQDEKKSESDDRNIIIQLIDFYVEHLIYTVPITILVVVIIVIIIIRNYKSRKNRTKVDL